MKTLQRITLAACLLSCLSLNTFAADAVNPAQLDTTPPPANGALTADQIRPLVLSQAASPQVDPTQPGAATAPQQPQAGQMTTTTTSTTTAPAK